jgi:mannose-6-phosphate isomerase-like protein (cupin superfamily)
MNIRALFIAAAFTFTALGANTGVDYYSAAQLKHDSEKLAANAKPKSADPAVEQLAKYSSDHSLIVYRNNSGTAEMHAHESDLYLVLDGEATLMSGGKMVGQHTKSEGEFLAASITGGHSQKLSKGDVVHISPNIPHQILLQPGHTFSYFVLKVKE